MDESADLELQALARSEIKMKTVAKNLSRKEPEDSASSSTPTIEVKDISDSELEGTIALDRQQTSRDANNALKRQQRLESIAEGRSENEEDHKTISVSNVSIGELMGEADADEAMEQANHEESERVVAQ